MPLAAPPVPSMAYSNMIDEKHLKKTFIVATLVSTLIGTFTSSHNLYERLHEQRKQKKRDEGQNDEINKLKGEIADMKKNGSKKEDKRDRGGHDAFLDAMNDSGALIQREFENGYARLGNRFAGGDLVTENALQKQIIQLQQTVINVLQDAVNSGRQLSQRDIDKLVMASDLARDGTLDALRQQYQRQSLPDNRRMSLPAPPPSERRMIAARSDAGDLAVGPPKRASTVPTQSLYCTYAMDLQDIPRRALAGAFDAGRGDSCCPDCHVRIAVNSHDRWKIHKVVPGPRKEERRFEIGPRFIVKCHTESGQFACILCNRNSEFDAFCKNPEVLVSHVGNAHDASEYGAEVDIIEI